MPTDSPNETSTAPQQSTNQGNRFFTWMRSLDLPRQPGWIGGVCAGIAQRIGIDPIIVRGIAIVAAVLGAPALLLYAAAWMMLPDHTGKIHAEQVVSGRFEAPVAGAGVMVLLSFLPSAPGFWFANAGWGLPFWSPDGWLDFSRLIWTLAIIASAIWLVVWIVRRSSNPASAADGTSQMSSASADPSTTPFATQPTTAAAPTDAAELAAWQDQQSRFKQERDEFARTSDEARRAAMAAHNAEQKRLRDARAAAYREEHRLTRSHPLFTLIAIGVALVAGALVLLVVGGATLTVSAVVAGLATTLGVLGAAIIVNGSMGKRSGGSSGLAVVVAIVLLLVSTGNGMRQFSSSAFVVNNDRFAVLADDARFSPRYADGRSLDYAVGVGGAVIDLRHYWAGEPMPDDSANRVLGTVSVVGGAGEITVILPDDEYVSVESIVGWGTLVTPDRDWGRGSFDDVPTEIMPDGGNDFADAPRELRIDAIVGAGSLTIITEGDLE